MFRVDLGDGAGVVVDVDLVTVNLFMAYSQSRFESVEFAHENPQGLNATAHPWPVGVDAGSEYLVPNPVELSHS